MSDTPLEVDIPALRSARRRMMKAENAMYSYSGPQNIHYLTEAHAWSEMAENELKLVHMSLLMLEMGARNASSS